MLAAVSRRASNAELRGMRENQRGTAVRTADPWQERLRPLRDAGHQAQLRDEELRSLALLVAFVHHQQRLAVRANRTLRVLVGVVLSEADLCFFAVLPLGTAPERFLDRHAVLRRGAFRILPDALPFALAIRADAARAGVVLRGVVAEADFDDAVGQIVVRGDHTCPAKRSPDPTLLVLGWVTDVAAVAFHFVQHGRLGEYPGDQIHLQQSEKLMST